MQLSKFTSGDLDIISIYHSHHGNFGVLNQKIEGLLDKDKPQLLAGDFNFCHLSSSSNPTRRYLRKHNFEQLIQEPTHIEGNILDQAHLRDIGGHLNCTVQLHSKYFTDHKGLAIIFKKGIFIDFYFLQYIVIHLREKDKQIRKQ